MSSKALDDESERHSDGDRRTEHPPWVPCLLVRALSIRAVALAILEDDRQVILVRAGVHPVFRDDTVLPGRMLTALPALRSDLDALAEVAPDLLARTACASLPRSSPSRPLQFSSRRGSASRW